MYTQRPYCLSASIRRMPPTSLGSFSTGVFYAPHGGLGDSEMWIRHTEDPSQGHGEHHSLAIIRSYLKLEVAGAGEEEGEGVYLRGCSRG